MSNAAIGLCAASAVAVVLAAWAFAVCHDIRDQLRYYEAEVDE